MSWEGRVTTHTNHDVLLYFYNIVKRHNTCNNLYVAYGFRKLERIRVRRGGASTNAPRGAITHAAPSTTRSL